MSKKIKDKKEKIGLGIVALSLPVLEVAPVSPLVGVFMAVIGVGVILYKPGAKKAGVASEDHQFKDANGDIVKYNTRYGLLTKAERSFYGVLESVVPDDLVIMSKVRIADVLVACKTLHTNDKRRLFAKISSKHFDFVLCNKADLSFVAAIELDDSSHQRKDRIERDKFVDMACASAGFPLYHCKAKYAYQPEELRSIVFPQDAPQQKEVVSNV